MGKVWRPHYQNTEEVISEMKQTEERIRKTSHSTFRCEYHIVFAPRYRRKITYGKPRKDIEEILRKLCEQKDVKSCFELI